MKLIGYCLRCHKVKRVNVQPSSLGRGVPYGVCDACLEEKR